MRQFRLILLLSLLPTAPGCRANPSPLAGVVMTIEFPDAGLTLDTMAGWGQEATYATIKLPNDYSTGRPFPALLFLGGATGGSGRSIDEGARVAEAAGGGFVVLNFPIFVREIEPLAADGSNRWTRLDLHDDDGPVMWKAYRLMLERVRAIVPNLDPERSFMGGFSNGAHATAVLLNEEPAEIRKWFGRFFFFEGGEGFTHFASLEGAPIAIVQGAAQPTLWQKPLHDRALAAKLDFEWILLEGVGHEMTTSGFDRLGAWVKREK